MKKFYNLDEAFHYQDSCPLCNEPIEADYKEMSMGHDLDSTKVVATFITPGSDEISIDYYHNNIVSYKEKQSYRDIYSIGSPGIIRQSTGNYSLRKSGVEFFGVNASCTKCSKYGYVLQMRLDWKEWMITGIFLNSESVSLERGDVLHEIKNVYATEKTEYTKFDRYEKYDETMRASGWTSKRDSTLTLPLISSDLSDPDKTLKRIKNLIIFS